MIIELARHIRGSQTKFTISPKPLNSLFRLIGIKSSASEPIRSDEDCKALQYMLFLPMAEVQYSQLWRCHVIFDMDFSFKNQFSLGPGYFNWRLFYIPPAKKKIHEEISLLLLVFATADYFVLSSCWNSNQLRVAIIFAHFRNGSNWIIRGVGHNEK